MAWDNWFEGELQSSQDNILWLSGLFGFRRQCIDPTHLNNADLMKDRKGLLRYYQ